MSDLLGNKDGTKENSSKRKNYDWAPHMPKMKYLYCTGISIPDICKEIQDKITDFTPSQEMVYYKFKKIGYPTNPNKRTQFLETLDPSRQLGMGANEGTFPAPQLLPVSTPASANQNYNITSYPPTNSNLHDNPQIHTTYSTPISITSDQEQAWFPRASYSLPTCEAQNQVESPDAPSGLGFDVASGIPPFRTAELPQHHSSSHVDMTTVSQIVQIFDGEQKAGSGFIPSGHQGWFTDNTLPVNEGQDHDIFSLGQPESNDYQVPHVPASNQDSDILPVASAEMSNNILSDSWKRLSAAPSLTATVEPLSDETFATMSYEYDSSTATPDGHVNRSASTFVNSTERGSDTHSTRNGHRIDRSSRNTPSPVDNNKVRNWVNPKADRMLRTLFIRSMTPEKRDSAYASGRNSPATTLVEDTICHSHSMLEFKGLYRAPCHQSHEPQPLDTFYVPDAKAMERFREITPCSECRYSSIHNLSWSARYLNLAVFKADLKLESKYDTTASDRAGNSALHYAAAGGAGYDHFDALIKAGVNPYQLNTAGQLFLHCLRPHVRDIGSEGFDEDLVARFQADLINLLNNFQPKGAFKWRDNEGRTVLDALASNITDADALKTRTFRHVEDAGYPLELSNQFPTRKSSLIQSQTQLSTVASRKNDVEFAVTQDKQEKAWGILGQASVKPSYVDPSTGDNVFHALARMKLSEKATLTKIQEYVKKDVDLNHLNGDGDCPLTAFINERPVFGQSNDETGATMSKYLDTLLWKDAHHRIRNRINVNMRNREGATALYYAATRGRPDSVRSLIEAGANVNARLGTDEHGISILQATMNAKAQAVHDKNEVKIGHFDNVISYLEHENSIAEPTPYEERALSEKSVRVMPNPK